MTDQQSKLIEEINSIKGNIMSYQKRMCLLDEILLTKDYTMNAPTIKYYKKGDWLETKINYLSDEKWIKFHLEQEKNLVIGEINKLETKLSKYVNQLQKILTQHL